jgi:hypothetical protein
MNRERKKQLIALFILVTFVGSSAAFALISVTGSGKTQAVQTVFEYPLNNSEEAPFLQQNYVIVKYFWSGNCLDCDLSDQALAGASTELNGTLVVEHIKMEDWANYTAELGITSVPTFYLKGNTIIITNTTNSDDLVRAICPLYFNHIEACTFLT